MVRQKSIRVVAPDEFFDRFAKIPYRPDGRCRVDHGQVAAVDELLDAERLDAELESAPPVGGGVEEDVGMQCGANVDPTRGEPFELNRTAPARIAEDHGDLRPALLPTRQPGEVGGLHL